MNTNIRQKSHSYKKRENGGSIFTELCYKVTLQKIVAANTRALRIARGLRQSDIAELTDLPRTYISHLEKGEVNVTVETIERIALALKVNPLVLLVENALQGTF